MYIWWHIYWSYLSRLRYTCRVQIKSLQMTKSTCRTRLQFCRPKTKRPTNVIRIYMNTILSPKAKMKICRPENIVNSHPAHVYVVIVLNFVFYLRIVMAPWPILWSCFQTNIIEKFKQPMQTPVQLKAPLKLSVVCIW